MILVLYSPHLLLIFTILKYYCGEILSYKNALKDSSGQKGREFEGRIFCLLE